MASQKPSPGLSTATAEKIVQRMAELGGTQAIASREFEPRLLQTSLFQECGEEYIWGETPSTPKRTFLCQNRPMLVRALAEALIQYELLARRLAKSIPQKAQQDTLAALERIEQSLALMPTRRQHASTHRPRRPTINKAWSIVQEAIRTLSVEDYVRVAKARRREARMHLLNTMCHTFAAYGPSAYTQTAVYNGIAIILLHFEIEKGTPEKVAARLLRWQHHYRKPSKG